jgi:hypothetical protein
LSSIDNYDRVSEVDPTPLTVNVRVLPTTVICTPPPAPLLNPPVAVTIPAMFAPPTECNVGAPGAVGSVEFSI